MGRLAPEVPSSILAPRGSIIVIFACGLGYGRELGGGITAAKTGLLLG